MSCKKDKRLSKRIVLSSNNESFTRKFRGLRQRTNKPAHESESLLSLHLIPLTSHLLQHKGPKAFYWYPSPIYNTSQWIIQVIPQALLPFQLLCSTSSIRYSNLINFETRIDIVFNITDLGCSRLNVTNASKHYSSPFFQ